MEAEKNKSIWISLFLPICLGVFASSVYFSAIKKQKREVVAYVAKSELKAGKQYEDFTEHFESTTVLLHADTDDAIVNDFAIKELPSSSFSVKQGLTKGEYLFASDLTRLGNSSK